MKSGKAGALLGFVVVGTIAASPHDQKQADPFKGEVAFCPSGRLAATTSPTGPIVLYRMTPKGWSAFRKLSASHPRQIVWGESGKTVVWTEAAGRLAIWRNGRISRITGSNPLESEHDMYSYALSPDESELAVARLDGLQLVRLRSMSTKRFATGEPVTSVAFDKGGNLYAGGRDLLWLPARNSSIPKAEPVHGFVRGLAVRPDGRRLAVLEDNCELAIYQLPLGKKPEMVWRSKGHPQAIAWSPIGGLLAIVLKANEKAGESASLNRVAVIGDDRWTEGASIPLPSWAAGEPEFDAKGSTLCVEVGDKTYFWSTASWKPAEPTVTSPDHR